MSVATAALPPDEDWVAVEDGVAVADGAAVAAPSPDEDWAVDPVWGAAVVAAAEDGATTAFGVWLARGLADVAATALLAVRAAAIMADAAELTPPTPRPAWVALPRLAGRLRSVARLAACGWPPAATRPEATAPTASAASTPAAGTALPARLQPVLLRGPAACRPVYWSADRPAPWCWPGCPPSGRLRVKRPTLLVPLRLVPAVKNSLTPFDARLRGHEGGDLSPGLQAVIAPEQRHSVQTPKRYFSPHMAQPGYR